MIKVNNLIEFVSMRRGGHHAVMSWIIKNLVGIQPEYIYDVIVLGNTGSVIIHDCTVSPKDRMNLFFDLKSKTENVFINYEDEKSNYTIFSDNLSYNGPYSITNNDKIKFNTNKRILIIRDFYNNLCSRIKGKTHIWDFNTDIDFIQKWKEHAHVCLNESVVNIKYDKWLIDKKYRNEFLFKNFGLYEKYGPNDVDGFKSSYIEGSKNYLNRFDPKIIPEETKNLIRTDNELHYLIGALGYEYKEI